MKVSAWKNIDVEVEVDVELEHVMAEFMSIANEEGMPNRKLRVIDEATRILEAIGSDSLQTIQQNRVVVAERIMQRLEKLLAWCRKAIEVAT